MNVPLCELRFRLVRMRLSHAGLTCFIEGRMPPMQAQQLDKALPSKPTNQRLCMTFERGSFFSNLGRSEKVMHSLSQIQNRRPPRCADVHAYDGICDERNCRNA